MLSKPSTGEMGAEAVEYRSRAGGGAATPPLPELIPVTLSLLLMDCDVRAVCIDCAEVDDMAVAVELLLLDLFEPPPPPAADAEVKFENCKAWG